MARLCKVFLGCVLSAMAVGCEPSAEEDEVNLTPVVSAEVPTESRQQSDYNKYAEEVCVKSPVSQDIKGEAEMMEHAKKDQ